MNQPPNARIQQTLSRLKQYPAPRLENSWPSYSDLELDEKTISDLVTILQLDAERELEGKDSLQAVHAWRILSEHRIERALPNLIECLVLSDEEDDCGLEELPRAISKFGATAIPELRNALVGKTIFREEVWAYIGVCNALEQIGAAGPEEKKLVCSIFAEALNDAELNSPLLNAYLISSLVDFKAVEYASAIENTFSKGLVDEDVVDWTYVRTGLKDLLELPEAIAVGKPPEESHYSGDARFQRLLKVVGSQLNVDEVRCLLVGSLLAVDIVPPSKILNLILTDIDGNEVEFETKGQVAYFTREFLGLWSLMCLYQETPFDLPSTELAPSNDLDESIQYSVRSVRRRMQLMSFFDGLELGGTRLGPPEADDSNSFLVRLNSRLRELEALEKKRDQETIARQRELLSEIDAYWSENYLDFAQARKQARARKLEQRNFLEAHKHVGRNEPCPCGSGKKFKKCCLPRYG